MTVGAEPIPFLRPWLGGDERRYVERALASGRLEGDGHYSQRCCAWLARQTGAAAVRLTQNCTVALQLSALLLDIRPGDEIIMPTFTFSSTANAFVLHGGVPVFVDIRPDTLNMDTAWLDAALSPRTRAVVPVHYAGVACEMDAVLGFAARHGLHVVEDAAQGLMASYRGRALGSLGTLGTFSFHASKNLSAGEGGALLINDDKLTERADIMRKTGADYRNRFCDEADRYTWLELAYSVLPGELTAALLLAQLEQAEALTRRRLASWEYYHAGLSGLERDGYLRRPCIPDHVEHNAIAYHIVLEPGWEREQVLAAMRREGVHASFHYVPLHSSPAGRRFGRLPGDALPVAEQLAPRLIRLPMWPGLEHAQQDRVMQSLAKALRADGG